MTDFLTENKNIESSSELLTKYLKYQTEWKTNMIEYLIREL